MRVEIKTQIDIKEDSEHDDYFEEELTLKNNGDYIEIKIGNPLRVILVDKHDLRAAVELITNTI